MAEREKKSPKNTRAMAGEFAVLSQLALHGLVATMTLGYTKGVDILVFNPDNQRMYQLEVKTRFRMGVKKSKRYGPVFEWVMSKKHEKLKNSRLFYCFVNIGKDDAFRYFVVPSRIVAMYVRREHRRWKGWSRPSAENDMRTFRLRVASADFPEWVLPARKYESKWNLLK